MPLRIETPDNAQRLMLYPPLEPYETGYLKLDDLHTLYYEQSGNPEGVPVVVLHGGPGAGSNPKHRQFFDPQYYRIILFDQRGAGKSTPLGELRQNTATLLVADMEQLRKHLNIDRWHVFGGSWGSTLALAYAIEHPAPVLSLTLRGIFLMSRREIEWFLYGMQTTFPEAWHDFVAPLSEEERKNILSSYYKKLTHSDENTRLSAAKKWGAYGYACLRLIPAPMEYEISEEADRHTLASVQIECHYFVYNQFDPDNYLMQNLHKIRHISCVIVQGRYDVMCPVVTAYEVYRQLPQAEFIIVSDAGHSSSEPGITSELVRAMDGYKG